MKLRQFLLDDDGAVAIEFALIAPLIVMAMLMMADIGLAAYDRMKLTNGVRGAAQYIITGGQSEEMMAAIVIRTASMGESELAIDVTEYCACSFSEASAVECSTVCEGEDITNVYARITAKTSSHRILRTWDLESSMEVRRR